MCTSPETPIEHASAFGFRSSCVRHRLYARCRYVGGLYLPASWLTALRAEVGS
jgi:hypothetical protein